ncbi:motility associated factor glycosyltransferase family protein [Aneurinibacillus uraniidurans]|uniref:motility associated factor glycosyltransferase family protein n=1 Tax=Aneurinibacillus uraniidurans TaxID=2966586 RepID=UPI00234B6748|nr:6-hydroxymethylpterin diphosphokinase MptE-like protein [Aneurinibacillus sp. B1]WCN38140.1 DUF115 domain-containing protein [Aneurinibacillus sp. B1]
MFWKKNVTLLKRKSVALYQEVCRHSIDETVYQVMESSNKEAYTVQIRQQRYDRKQYFFLHSKYHPYKEAVAFAEGNYNAQPEELVLYGFGLGYHVIEVGKRLQGNQRLSVFDINLDIFCLAMHYVDLESVFIHPNIILCVSEDGQEVAGQLRSVLHNQSKLMLHMPSVRAMPDQYEKLRFVLEDWNIQQSARSDYFELIQANYRENRMNQHSNVSSLFGSLQGKPIVIVSAGPSLNKNGHLLAQVKEKAFIFAVGSALKPLLRMGVTPDMFCIMDPQQITYKQIEGYENLDIPFVYLDSVHPYTVEKYQGPKYVASSDISDVPDTQKVQYGGSVATAVMDMAIRFGGNPIVFVGQDLAYTNNEHHADGSMYGEEKYIEPVSTMRKVKGQNGEWLYTRMGLLSFKHWIENKISDHPSLTFINATEGGALIEGCEHISLQNFISLYCDR